MKGKSILANHLWKLYHHWCGYNITYDWKWWNQFGILQLTLPFASYFLEFQLAHFFPILQNKKKWFLCLKYFTPDWFWCSLSKRWLLNKLNHEFDIYFFLKEDTTEAPREAQIYLGITLAKILNYSKSVWKFLSNYQVKNDKADISLQAFIQCMPTI